MSALGPLIVIPILVVLVVAIVRRSQGRSVFAEQSTAARVGYIVAGVAVLVLGVYLSTASR